MNNHTKTLDVIIDSRDVFKHGSKTDDDYCCDWSYNGVTMHLAWHSVTILWELNCLGVHNYSKWYFTFSINQTLKGFIFFKHNTKCIYRKTQTCCWWWWLWWYAWLSSWALQMFKQVLLNNFVDEEGCNWDFWGRSNSTACKREDSCSSLRSSAREKRREQVGAGNAGSDRLCRETKRIAMASAMSHRDAVRVQCDT